MSKIYDIFLEEYVILTLNRDSKGNVQDERGNIKLLQQEMQVKGYLFDEDDDYFFLSYEPDGEFISLAVQKKQVVTMELCNPNEEEDQMAQDLDESVGPNDTGVN